MNYVEPQSVPVTSRLYLADVLSELAGPDLDVELDALLSDDDLPLEWRHEVAGQREALITETKRRVLELRAHIDKRHRIHADRAGYAEARRQAERRREEERREAEQRREAERLMLDVARRRAESLGFVLEPIRIQHTSPSRPAGWGQVTATSEERAWRVTAPNDHPAVEHNREHLAPTLDRKSVELQRGSMRSCCEWLALHADAHRETPTPEPRSPFRRRRETP